MPNRASRQQPAVQQSFVVRIWREDPRDTAPPPSGAATTPGRSAPVTREVVDAGPGDAGAPDPGSAGSIVRGSVQLVGRDSIRYFTSLESLMQILADGADLPLGQSSGSSAERPDPVSRVESGP